MLPVRLLAALGALLLLLGCTANVEPRRTGAEPLSGLVAQRVTATVKREARRLVRLETERETFLTTPEHPFATPRSGWVSAGRLRPGDWVVSERFGAVRLLSVRSAPAPQTTPVFNLSVASSHAYFVGTDRVLVHNTKCRPKEDESPEDFIDRLLHERAELTRQIEEQKQTDPKSPGMVVLKAKHRKLTNKIYNLRKTQRENQGALAPHSEEATRQGFEAEKETARKALEDAQKALAELGSRRPTSRDEEVTQEARKAELKKQISALTLNYERLDRILTWLRELAELEKDTPATDADRRASDEKKKELRARLALERKRLRDVKHVRRKRADPQGRDERAKQARDEEARRFRRAAYLADTTRPRDPLELLEEELTRLLQEAPSESRDARIHHLTESIATKKRLADVRRQAAKLNHRVYYARHTREELVAEGKDPSEVDKRLVRVNLELRAVRVERAQLRVRERLLALLDETPWAHGPRLVDEAQLREFERELAGDSVDDQQLARIEAALDAMNPTDADWEQAVREEAHDVDATLREWEALLHQSPSPERRAELQSSFERLQRELREERGAVDAAVFALANEYASIQTTRAGSSSGPTWQERLVAIHQEQLDLRAQWQARLSARLDSARRRLEDLQRLDRFRDEAIEAELAREIALLERELQLAGG